MNISQNSNTQLSIQLSEIQEAALNHDVTFFAICNAAKIEGIAHTDIISPFFEVIEQALEFKDSSLEKCPDCFSAKYVFEYSLESAPERLELLAKIVGGSFQPA